MNASLPLPLPGCRHDVLGHALKAIGVLRAISDCASPEDCDRFAEGWWNPDTASFMVRSDRYPDADSLARFFAEKYRPTPMIAAWNKSGGVTDKIVVTISCGAGNVGKFRECHNSALEGFGLKKTKNLSNAGTLTFTLKDQSSLNALKQMASKAGLGCTHKLKRLSGTAKAEVTIVADTAPLQRFREDNSARLDELGFGTDKNLSATRQLKFSTDSSNKSDVEKLVADFNASATAAREEPTTRADDGPTRPDGPLCVEVVAKESGKKDGTLPSAARLMTNGPAFRECLELARQWVDDLQGGGRREKRSDAAIVRYRDHLPDGVAESFDALTTVHLSRQNDSPLFVNRGQQGSTDIFLMYWDYFVRFRKNAVACAHASLFGERVVGSGSTMGEWKGKGTPFFPDAIKNYNQGMEWVTETFPFCPLDYLLAVEGSLAMRGAVSKSLGVRSRSHAAFPFVFEGTETMTDDQGNITGLGASFWLPFWTRPTTYGELRSFILDSQARLPRKDCRYSSDFARAVRSQGVDAGFAAFQEFRFKMKGARVPWAVSGRFLECSGTAAANVLNELLAPVDASGFLDQFEFHSGRDRKRNLHPLRAPLLDAIENAAVEPDASTILDVLCCLAKLNAQLARSKSLRKTIDDKGRVAFVPPLRCDDWAAALQDLEKDPEFEIARAVASIRGHEKQPGGGISKVEPFLGSLVPLRRGQHGWFVPDTPSPQAVWTGINLTRDLASILARRVLDSSADFRPAVIGTYTAKLATILRFLRGELDDRRIASLVEAISLIDWRYPSVRQLSEPEEILEDERLDPLPIAYASIRAILEIACEKKPRDGDRTAGRPGPLAHVQRTVSLVTRQEAGMVAAATREALRRLATVGVSNTYRGDNQRQKHTLAGRDVIALESAWKHFRCGEQLSRRLAAALLIPLDPRDRWRLFRSITLPQTVR